MSEQNPGTLYCANHPNRETVLRCNRCDKPICNECAILTPTGYRCRECVRGQQKIFNTATPVDYVLGILVAGILGFLGSLVVSFIAFFTIFLAPIIGVMIAETVRTVVRRHRSKLLFQSTTAAAAIGGLLLPALSLLGGRFSLLGLLWPVLYVVLITSTIYYRLSGIQMR